ncbi:fibrobacter succinogenes major paralogous domain-containing protein [Saccharicrinis sp. FJH54]|uniref:fibrobacter succinogenes major paralogous domain-containing protein n=1 Tax=Saccharicrinis sp. FJH54 TaxID=3344665 RepID=UPI0035D51B8F
MKKISIILFLITIIAAYSEAQIDGYKNRAVNQNETVTIKLDGTEGTIVWEKSIDKLTWEVIENVTDQLDFVADQTTYFRVISTVEGCYPDTSDLGSVTVYGEMSDIDGNMYKTIQIGDQVWMAENLRVTHYPDGQPIFKGVADSSWAYTDSLAFCWYNNDSAAYAVSHGALYNWGAAMNGSFTSSEVPSGVQGVCPDGWHLPSDMEWQILEQSLGMSSAESGETGWNGTNEGAKLAGKSHLWAQGVLISDEQFGESGFNGLPTGDRTWDDESIFYGDGIFGTWWTSTRLKSDNTWSRYIQFDRMEIRRAGTWKWNGNSVRCVKN